MSMLVLTKDAFFLCDHRGRANPEATQKLVFIDDVPVLVFGNPVGRTIRKCPNYNPPAGIKPCTVTYAVDKGYSGMMRIAGEVVCLSGVEGYTDGMPSGQVRYNVQKSGQNWVRGQ
jgi:hypothetical protein